MIVNALASLHKNAGDLAEAERLYAEAHGIFGPRGKRVVDDPIATLPHRRSPRALAVAVSDVVRNIADRP